MIIRNKLKDISEALEFFPIVGIIGPRQVGKTTIAQEITKNINKESIYIDLENPRDLAKLQDPILYFEDNIDKCIILDEIQNTPHLFPILRSMVDMKREPSRFIILGSASPELIRGSSESLAGRIAYIELSPFNLTEVYKERIQDRLWLRGGYPNAFLSPKAKFVEQWHYNYLKTYVERDLPNLGLSVDKNTLIKLFQMLSHIHADIINYSNLSKSLSLSVNTIKKYISFFESAFLVRLLQPFHTNIKKRLTKSPKLYIRDSGILHYLQNINEKEDLYGNPLIGNSWEGFVIEQIIEILPDKFQVYFYRTQNGAECDLVIAKSQKPIVSIEIKYSSSPKLGKGTFYSFKDLQTENNYVITPNSDDYLIKENVRVCSLYQFLTKYIPK
ncbi:MAG: ATPase [Bacteroidetes bacterium]|nr:MAG: ATPase [Bacteroidota bacterium]